jgi:glutaredoxin
MKYETRNYKIKRMRAIGYSLYKIGSKIGLTGERVRQLEAKMGLPPRGKKVTVLVDRKCAHCKKIMKVKSYLTKKFCSKECLKASRPPGRTPEMVKDYRRLKSIRYYYNVIKKRPDFHEYVKRNNDKAQKKLWKKK